MKSLSLLICLLFLVFSCNQYNSETPEPSEFGYLSMSISVTITEEAASGRIEAVSTDDWSVTIFNASDDSEVINFTPFVDAPAEVQLPTGEYYIEAHSNNFQEAAFENPYYFGRSENFTIDKEELKTIDIDAELANTKVAINYSANVTSTFDDYTGAVTVVSTGTTLPFVQGETREGYFVAEPLSVVVDLSYTKLDGTFITRQFNADIDAQPKTLYSINVDATLEDGEIMININVDEGFETVEIDLGESTTPKIFLDDNGITIKATPDAVVGDSEVINGITYTVVSEQELRDMAVNGEDLTIVCTSLVTNMSDLIPFGSFNQDISSWDVSNVVDMFRLFDNTFSFNQDISAWDVSSVEEMTSMFENAASFNQDISSWDVRNVKNMSFMFRRSAFNQDIGSWDVSNVQGMFRMFMDNSSFNQDLSSWNVSDVRNMKQMFSGATAFNQNIGNWDVSKTVNMEEMFFNAVSFNQDLSTWNVSNVTFCANFKNTGNWVTPIFTNCTP